MNVKQEYPFLIPLLCGLAACALVAISIFGSHEANPSLALASVRASLPEPELSAEAYLVRLAGDEEPLMERRVWKRLAPASLTKLMTAVIAAEILESEETAAVSPEAKAVEERRSPVEIGEALSRDDLLRLTLVSSANDAALALAEAAGRSAGGYSFPEKIETFVRLMNAKAQVLGFEETHFENPTGLDAPGHYSSARDLARMAEYVLYRHPRLWEMTRSSEAAVSASGGRRYVAANTNDLLKEFPAIRGGKTGFTENAKGALLLLYPVRSKSPEATAAPSAERTSNGVYPVRPGRTAIIVILKSEDRFGDGRKVIRWLEQYGAAN